MQLPEPGIARSLSQHAAEKGGRARCQIKHNLIGSEINQYFEYDAFPGGR